MNKFTITSIENRKVSILSMEIVAPVMNTHHLNTYKHTFQIIQTKEKTNLKVFHLLIFRSGTEIRNMILVNFIQFPNFQQNFVDFMYEEYPLFSIVILQSSCSHSVKSSPLVWLTSSVTTFRSIPKKMRSLHFSEIAYN